MARPAISNTRLSDTLTLSLCHDGYWLYDKTRGMNLSIRAKTSEAALLEALMYYQKRLKEYETSYNCLKSRVDEFVSQFVDEDEESD